MKKFIYQADGGVSLQVDYRDNVGIVGQIEFHGIHVLDENYRPVGPDLGPFLHQLVVLTNDGNPKEATGERFLSALIREIRSEEIL